MSQTRIICQHCNRPLVNCEGHTNDKEIATIWRRYGLDLPEEADDDTFGTFVDVQVRRDLRLLIDAIITEREAFYHDESDHLKPCSCRDIAGRDFGIDIASYETPR